MSTPPVILITGASSGIGEATARLFSRKNYRVVLAARRIDRLDKLAAEIQKDGGQALAVKTDVTKTQDLHNLVDTVLQQYGQIDVLVNNAGFGHLGWLENLHPQKDIDDQLQTNLVGLIHLTQAVLPHMLSRKQGHIINISSVAGLVAPPTYSVYAASKFGVRAFSDALRRELRGNGIHISLICPGSVATEFGQHVGMTRRTRVTTPSFIRMSAERVAETIYKVSLRPRRVIIIPWFMKLVYWLEFYAPAFFDWAIGKYFFRKERLLK